MQVLRQVLKAAFLYPVTAAYLTASAVLFVLILALVIVTELFDPDERRLRS